MLKSTKKKAKITYDHMIHSTVNKFWNISTNIFHTDQNSTYI